MRPASPLAAFLLLLGASFVAAPAQATGLPDLAAVQLTATPAAPTEFDAVTLTLRIQNEGGSDSGVFGVEFWVGGESFGLTLVPSLSPGEMYDATSEVGTLPIGTHTVYAGVDPEGWVDEDNTANNGAQIALTVADAPPRPDLVVFVEPNTAEPTATVPYQLRATVVNIGTVNAAGFSVAFKLDGASIGTASTSGLAAGQSVALLSPIVTSVAGWHTAFAHADPLNAVPEESESNNVDATDFYVIPYGVDISVEVVSVRMREAAAVLVPIPALATPVVTLKVCNGGPAPANEVQLTLNLTTTVEHGSYDVSRYFGSVWFGTCQQREVELAGPGVIAGRFTLEAHAYDVQRTELDPADNAHARDFVAFADPGLGVAYRL